MQASSTDQILKNLTTSFKESNYHINLTNLITGIINIILLVSMTIAINIHPVSSVYIMDYITDNLLADPIGDITYSKGNQCPEQYYPTLLGKWPGSKKGTFVDGLIFDFYPTYATSATVIEPINEIDLYFWKSRKICIKKIKDYSLIDDNSQ